MAACSALGLHFGFSLCIVFCRVDRESVGGGAAFRPLAATVLPGPTDQDRRVQLLVSAGTHQQPATFAADRMTYRSDA